MLIINEKQIQELKKILFTQQNEDVVNYFLKIYQQSPVFGSTEKFENWLKNRLDYACEWDLTDVNYIIDFIRYSIEFPEIKEYKLADEIIEIMTYPGRTQEMKVFALFIHLTKIEN